MDDYDPTRQRLRLRLRQVLPGTEALQMRFGFVPAPAETYGLDPSLGRLGLWVGMAADMAVPLAVPAGIFPPAGDTTVEGRLVGVPVWVQSGDGPGQRLWQAVVLVSGFSDAPARALLRLEARIGPPGLPGTRVLRLPGQAPLLLQPTAPAPPPGAAVAVRARPATIQAIVGACELTLLCLRGTASPASPAEAALDGAPPEEAASEAEEDPHGPAAWPGGAWALPQAEEAEETPWEATPQAEEAEETPWEATPQAEEAEAAPWEAPAVGEPPPAAAQAPEEVACEASAADGAGEAAAIAGLEAPPEEASTAEELPLP